MALSSAHEICLRALEKLTWKYDARNFHADLACSADRWLEHALLYQGVLKLLHFCVERNYLKVALMKLFLAMGGALELVFWKAEVDSREALKFPAGNVGTPRASINGRLRSN
jgi:hypothetical protein